MALLVMKFGGTSVASVKHMDNVAAKVRQEKQAGNDVLVVVLVQLITALTVMGIFYGLCVCLVIRCPPRGRSQAPECLWCW